MVLEIDKTIRELRGEIRPRSFYGSAWTYPIVMGPALTRSLEDATRIHFTKVIATSSDKKYPRVRYQLARFNPALSLTPDDFMGATGSVLCDTAVRVTVTDRRGMVLLSQIASGAGHIPGEWYFGITGGVSMLEDACRQSIQEVVEQVSLILANNPRLFEAFKEPTSE